MAEVDRSRIIAYQRCPRERFLAYHLNGTGIQRIRKSLPLQFGSAFHVGAEELLSHVGHPSVDINRVEYAVEQALAFLQDEFSAHQISFDGEQLPDVELAMRYGQEEQMALAEALLRAWWAYEGEAFLRTFEVISVEQEGRAQLADDLTLMFRPDALVRDRESGDHYIVSWKTCATFGKRNTDQARHDAQSISEAFGVMQERGIKVEGILYKFICKGRRSLDRWDSLYKQGSHLIYGWLKLDTANSEFPEWSWSYDWQDEEGKSRKLGKGWQKKSIWNNYPGGVKAWVEGLAKQEIFPRTADALAEVFPQAMPVERHEQEVRSWKTQVIAQELNIAKSVELVANWDDEYTSNHEILDTLFPQHSASCHSYSGCSFIPICWEGVPAQAGELYQIRSANHPEKGDEE